MTLSDDVLDELREQMMTGKCDGITIWKNHGGGFQASVRRTATQGWKVETDDDPSIALSLALGFDVPRTPVKKKRDNSDLI